MTENQFRELCMQLENVEELPHFEKTSFRIKKKIFATLNAPAGRATVLLTEEDQSLYFLMDKEMVYPVPNKWGKYGWTHISLAKALPDVVEEILQKSYRLVQQKIRKNGA